MIDLAVTTQSETYERLAAGLPDHGVHVHHLPVDGRVVPLDADPETGFDVGWVYPSRLMEGGVVDARRGLPWLNDRSAVLRSRNKAGALARLRRAGIPVPRTTFVSNPVDGDELDDVFDAFDRPVVVKPNSATRGAGVVRIDDPDSFRGVTDYLDLVHSFPATDDRSFLVQSFVPDARDYRITVLDGTVVGAVERRSDGWARNVHRGASPRAVDPPDGVRDRAIEAARALDIRFLGVDVLVGDDGNAQPLVVETNARPTVDEERFAPDFYERAAAAIRRIASEDS